MGPLYAGILGQLAFVVALARGLLGGGSAGSTAFLAVICLGLFAAIGYLAGRVADQVLWDSIQAQFQNEMRARE
jgi:hypothetical protein